MPMLDTKMVNSDRVVSTFIDFGESNADAMQGLKVALVARGVPEEEIRTLIAKHAIANLTVAFRSRVKAKMILAGHKTMSDAQIQVDMNDWKPSVPTEKDPNAVEKKLESLSKIFGGLSADKQTSFLEDLAKTIAARQAASATPEIEDGPKKKKHAA